MVKFAGPRSFSYELNMVLRDARGNPIVDGNGNALRKHLKTDSPGKLALYYETQGTYKR